MGKYDPYKHGRRNALDGLPPVELPTPERYFQYNRGYMDGQRERMQAEANKPRPPVATHFYLAKMTDNGVELQPFVSENELNAWCDGLKDEDSDYYEIHSVGEVLHVGLAATGGE